MTHRPTVLVRSIPHWHRLTSAAALAACAVAAPAQNLSALVRAGLQSDPAVAGAAAQVRAAEQRVYQARAAFGPTANVTGTASDGDYRELGDVDARNLRSKQLTFQVTLPLWRGTLFPALDGARSQLAQAQAALAQAQAEAGQRIVEASFEVLKSRDALAFARAQRVAAGEQLLAARRALEVGTAPVTDVRDAEAKADAVAAQLLGIEADLAMRQQVLAELSGQSWPGLLTRGLDGLRLPEVAPGDVLQWLADAQAGNPQIAQARLALEAAEAEVRKAQLGHAPSADANYTYTKSSDNGTVTTLLPRSGRTSALGVTVNIPLFASGATESKVQESVALRDKARSDIDVARRTVSLAVRQAFSATLAAVAQARGLEAAVRSQETALRANRRAYEVGMKVNAEVLEAQSKLFEARRDRSRARYDAWNGYLKLKAQLGQLGEVELAQADALLIEAASPELLAPRRPAP